MFLQVFLMLEAQVVHCPGLGPSSLISERALCAKPRDGQVPVYFLPPPNFRSTFSGHPFRRYIEAHGVWTQGIRENQQNESERRHRNNDYTVSSTRAGLILSCSHFTLF